MDDQRTLGRLEQATKNLESNHRELKNETMKRFDNVDKKLDSLAEFKWRVLGGAMVAAFLVEVTVTLVEKLFP